MVCRTSTNCSSILPSSTRLHFLNVKRKSIDSTKKKWPLIIWTTKSQGNVFVLRMLLLRQKLWRHTFLWNGACELAIAATLQPQDQEMAKLAWKSYVRLTFSKSAAAGPYFSACAQPVSQSVSSAICYASSTSKDSNQGWMNEGEPRKETNQPTFFHSLRMTDAKANLGLNEREREESRKGKKRFIYCGTTLKQP